jgi:hypothetical protein
MAIPPDKRPELARPRHFSKWSDLGSSLFRKLDCGRLCNCGGELCSSEKVCISLGTSSILLRKS